MRLFCITGGVLLAFAISGCDDADDLEGEQNQRHEELKEALDWSENAELLAADSCAHAEEAFKAATRTEMELALDHSLRCALPGRSCYNVDGVVGGERSNSTTPAINERGHHPHTLRDTHLPIDGAEEADIVQTDGQDIVGIFDQYIVSSRAWPPEDLHEVAHVRLPGTPKSLYLEGDHIVVLSHLHGAPYPQAYRDRHARNADNAPSFPIQTHTAYNVYGWPVDGTLLTVIDRAGDTLTVQTQHFFEGTQIDSRRVGAHIYLALSHPRHLPHLSFSPDLDVYNASESAIRRAFDKLRTQNLRIIDELSLDWWVPQRYTLDAHQVIDPASEQPLTACDHLYVPRDVSGAETLVSLIRYDLLEDTLSSSTVLAEPSVLHMSSHALYLASSNWQWRRWWGAEDVDPPEVRTQIHALAFEEEGNTNYNASGTLEGHPLDRFAVDEDREQLRVATTHRNFGWNAPTTGQSQIRVFTPQQGTLTRMGHLDSLVDGESIYAVRFIGDNAYVATFRHNDPLYVVDLSGPAHPRAAGTLETPGYSTYIHPLDDDHLLTLGPASDREGRTRGLTLEIFELQDPTAPKSVRRETITTDWGVDTDARYEHKSFMYFPAHQLLAIPVSGWQSARSGVVRYQAGLHLFRVAPDVIESLAVLTHEALFPSFTAPRACDLPYDASDMAVQRGMFLDNVFYTLSNAGIVVHDLRIRSGNPLSGLVANPRIASALEETGDGCRE